MARDVVGQPRRGLPHHPRRRADHGRPGVRLDRRGRLDHCVRRLSGIGNYSAAKAAVVNLAQTLNSECRSFGIRVNAVCPGFIKTALVTDNEAGFDALLPGEMTLDQVIATKQSRWGEPEDVAAAVCFLAGDRAPWISGAAYTIDGGFRASLL